MCFEPGGIQNWLVSFFCSDHWKQNKQQKQGLIVPLVSLNKALLNPYFWGGTLRRGRLTSHGTMFPQLTTSSFAALSPVPNSGRWSGCSWNVAPESWEKNGEVCIGWWWCISDGLGLKSNWHIVQRTQISKKIHSWKPRHVPFQTTILIGKRSSNILQPTIFRGYVSFRGSTQNIMFFFSSMFFICLPIFDSCEGPVWNGNYSQRILQALLA